MLHHSSQDNQPKFDMVESAGVGYHYLYTERQYLMKLIAVPFLIKFVTILFLSLFDDSISYFSMSLISLPAIFAEAWLLSQVLRSFVFNERWPITLSGEKELDQTKLLNRQNCIIAGIITYTLIQIVIFGMQSLITMTPEQMEAFTRISAGEALPEGSSVSYTPIITFVVLLFTLIFWFPLLWMYIPAAANIYLKDFYMTIASQRLVFRLIGCWIICVVPLMALLTLASNFLITAFAIDMNAYSTAERIMIDTLSGFIALLVHIVCTVAIAHGIGMYFSKNKKD